MDKFETLIKEIQEGRRGLYGVLNIVDLEGQEIINVIEKSKMPTL